MRRAVSLLLALTVAITATVGTATSADAAVRGVTILSTDLTQYPALGFNAIVGELRNDTRLPVEGVEVTVDYHDANSVLLGSETDFSSVWRLDPGETSPFFVLSGHMDAASYTARASYRATTEPGNHNFLIAITSNATDASGRTTIVGTITNANTTPADRVNVIAEFRDVDGTLLDAILEFPNTGGTTRLLAPNESASFEFEFADFDYDTYTIFGDSESAPTSPVTLAASPSVQVYGGPVRPRARPRRTRRSRSSAGTSPADGSPSRLSPATRLGGTSPTRRSRPPGSSAP